MTYFLYKKYILKREGEKEIYKRIGEKCVIMRHTRVKCLKNKIVTND